MSGVSGGRGIGEGGTHPEFGGPASSGFNGVELAGEGKEGGVFDGGEVLQCFDEPGGGGGVSTGEEGVELVREGGRGEGVSPGD